LYLRHAARTTDAVFIDEPEAHFHPKSQVSLAQALMAAAREVENVVIATHSEFLVSELSNVVMAEAAESPSAVPSLRIYEFIPSDPRGGVTVKQHTFDPLEGFDIEQFSRVAEETYERSVEIYNRAHGASHES
jgi:predicted ATPase